MARDKKRRGRGEGSVELLPDGRWRAVLSLGTVNGKRKRRKFYGKTKKDALQKLRDAQGRLGKGPALDAGNLTLAGWLAEWVKQKTAKVEPKTAHRYAQTVAAHLTPRLGTHRLSHLSAAHVESLYAGMAADGLSRSEQRRAGSTLSSALADACRLRLIPANPCRDVRQPQKSGRRKPHPLAREEAARFLAAAEGERLYAMFVLWIDAGLRPGEMYALTWADLDLDAGTVSVTKSVEAIGGRQRVKDTKTPAGNRTLSLSAFTVEALRKHRAGCPDPAGPVFVGTRGAPIREGNIHRQGFGRVLARAGLSGVRPYDLRHTCATLLLEAGVNVKVVSERLGHASIQVTLDHYAHVLPGMQKIAADAMEGILRSSPAKPPDPGSSENGKVGKS